MEHEWTYHIKRTRACPACNGGCKIFGIPCGYCHGTGEETEAISLEIALDHSQIINRVRDSVYELINRGDW